MFQRLLCLAYAECNVSSGVSSSGWKVGFFMPGGLIIENSMMISDGLSLHPACCCALNFYGLSGLILFYTPRMIFIVQTVIANFY